MVLHEDELCQRGKRSIGNGLLSWFGLYCITVFKTFQKVLRNKLIICSSQKRKIIALVVAVIVIAIIIAVVLVVVLKKSKEEKENVEGKTETSIPPLPTGKLFHLS